MITTSTPAASIAPALTASEPASLTVSCRRTLAIRWSDALAARCAPASDRGAALLAVIFFMILVAGLSVVLLSAILSQAAPALTAQKNTHTVYSAQAGLQAALGLIRSATEGPNDEGKTFGETKKLPCAVDGKVTADDAGASYSVTIDYFREDPTGKSDEWRASATNKIPCSSPGGLTDVPNYAYIHAAGEDAAVASNPDSTYGDRFLEAVYKFKVSNPNVPGGEIYDANKGHCLQANSADDGANIQLVPIANCHESDLQMWIYATDYELKLASTVTKDFDGMCITGPVTGTQRAVLQPCRKATDIERWNQLWSWTGSFSWVGQQQNIGAGPSNYCLSPDGEPPYLMVRNGCSGSFTPSTTVGAGAAGYKTHQIVNYKEFGRCADVTDENINSTYMISYPCKQDPSGQDGKYILWNHKWHYDEPEDALSPGPQNIYIENGGKYCLTAPLGDGRDLRFLACSAGDEQQEWTRVYDTGQYSSSYVFLDYLGRCMATNNTDLYKSFYSKVQVAECNGSLEQKWNAPPNYVESTFGSFREVTK